MTRGVVLASGFGTRLGVMTQKIVNKHLCLIYDVPMIYLPIMTLVKSGITDIAIVIGGNNCEKFIPLLGNGEDLGIKNLHYIYQKEPKGIAQAISLCEGFSNGDSIAVILGDNLFSENFSKYIKQFEEDVFIDGGDQARVFLKSVGFEEAKRFGCAIFDPNDGRIEKIIEKPQNPPTDYAVTGMYLYTSDVFDRIKKLPISSRNEIEVSDLNQSYIDNGNLDYYVLHDDSVWLDLGVPDKLLEGALYRQQIVKETVDNE